MNTWLVVTAIGTYILGLLSGYANRFISLFFLSVKIKGKNALPIYKYIVQNAKFKFNFAESLSIDNSIQMPETEASIAIVNNILMWVDISEKYLTAGSQAKEEIVYLSFLRWQKKKLYKLIKELDVPKPNEVRSTIKVFLSRWSYFKEIASLKKEKYNSGLFLSEAVDNELQKLVTDFKEKRRERAGILLYGPPGNGKTSVIRQLACKFDMDIYVPVLRGDMTNEDVINLFTEVPIDKSAMIVLEDFDSVFWNRESLYRDCKFSFDVFLNILDGLYSNLDNKIVIMTANDIERIDKALKHRPSRFDVVLHLENPSESERRKILSKFNLDNTEQLVKLTDRQSAAIVAEIGRRRLNNENEIQAAISSFMDEHEKNNRITVRELSPKTLFIPEIQGWKL